MKLSTRLQEEFSLVDRYYSRIPRGERLAEFERTISEHPDIVEEFENIPEALYREWRYYRECNTEKPWTGIFEVFVKTFEPEFPFEQLAKISGELLVEWRLKCDYESVYEFYSDVYGTPNKNTKDFYEKSKTELWNEFVEFWYLDTNETGLLFPNTSVFDSIVSAISEYEENFDNEEFYEYREDSNYHSYDSYSIAEQYRICKEFSEAL